MLDHLERGRRAYRRMAWGDAYDSLSQADRLDPLGADDLERAATAAYLTGRNPAHSQFLERAHHAHLEAGSRERAGRCAFWLGLTLLLRGETGQANAWFARARRLVDGLDCPEEGYLLVPVAERHLAEGDGEAAHAAAAGAAAVGERFADADLVACARHLQGRARIRQGRIPAGLVLLDEAMLAAAAGELSPIMTGLIYCSLIEACQAVHAAGRAREWTDALGRWCEAQPQMVAFTATCLVRRAEIMALSGDWPAAMAEARRACEAIPEREGRSPPATALYQRAELDRLRGRFPAAERSYREAGRLGWEPQPGLALLRLAQGRSDAAGAAIRRVLSATKDPLARARLLPAQVEIMLAVRDVQEAREACRELEGIAEQCQSDVLRAAAGWARGAIELAEGDAQASLVPLRQAFELWQRVEAPYEVARVRVLTGLACRSLGDDETAGTEFSEARAVFERLGAEPDLAHLDTLEAPGPEAGHGDLTPRELQVLRLIAAGGTNKAIADELFLSERTIDRHVSNILAKLNVPSRAAAIAHGYEHHLL